MLEQTLKKIKPLNENAMAAARDHHNRLAIPAGSLGRLHAIAIQLAGITGAPKPVIQAPAIVTMAADHGVAARGVSLFPQEVTREMVANFMRGGAAINVLARQFGIRLTVVDIGVAGPLQDVAFAPSPMLNFINARIADGTADITRGPAMDRVQALAALETGISVFKRVHDEGADAVGTGDMGIANTTASAAVASVLLDRNPAMVVNRGTGIDNAALAHKIRMVEQSIEVNRPDAADPLDVLAKIGGFEIGGIAGVILAACAHRVPVVVDGFISTAGALLAAAFHPDVKDYLFAGHQSAVDGHKLMLDSLDLIPLADLGMRLGEGTGAAFGLSIVAAAAATANSMLTFEEAAVSGPAIAAVSGPVKKNRTAAMTRDVPGFTDVGPARLDFQYLENLATGYWYSESLFAALELRLFHHIETGPMDTGELARAAACRLSPLGRLMETLAGMDLVSRSNGRWFNNPLARRFLLPGEPDYMGGLPALPPVSANAVATPVRTGGRPGKTSVAAVRRR